MNELTVTPAALAASLSKRYDYTGLVGFKGHQIDIKCDGSWRLSKASQSLTDSITQSGKFGEGEIKALMPILTESNSLSTLPETIGGRSMHYPVATITLGAVKKTAYIRVDGTTPFSIPDAKAFREIVTDVQRLLGIDGASEEN